MVKIYSDDPLVHYKNSSVSPERTKAEIDGILGQWGIKDTHWHWVPEHNDVFVEIRIEENMPEFDLPVVAVVKLHCPVVWDKAKPKGRPPRGEQVNWRVSMRALHWFLKTHLEMAYVMKSDKIRALLSHIKVSEKEDLGDMVIPRLSQIQDLAALPEMQKSERKLIEAEEQS